MSRWVYALLVFLVWNGTSIRGAEKTAAKRHVLDGLVHLLGSSRDTALQRDVLRGMYEALQGRRRVQPPVAWSTVYPRLAASADAEVREKALWLAVLFGDARALASLRQTVSNPKADVAARRSALEVLVDKHAADLLPLLRLLLADAALRGPALRGLAAVDDASVPALILRHYASFTEAEKADAISTLASRPSYALALLDALAHGKIPRRDLSPYTARQLVALGHAQITDRLNKVWGSVRPPAKERAGLLTRYKALVTASALGKANRAHGRQVFARTCASCHTLFNAGGKIGPDLTGSQRTNPEYILTKVLDPNAVVAKDYQVTMLTTTSGRVITGIIKQETAKTVVVQTPTEVVRLSRKDIEQRKELGISMMPEGQLSQMTDVEIRDLIAYLAGAGQVPLPKDASR